MVDAVEPALARFDRGVFLVDYPATQASLARLKPGDAQLAERFELYVAGVELCNGFGELVDAAEQRARLVRDQAERQTRGLPVYPVDERFLEALARVPPSAGNALGFDRLVALACGELEIASVMAFTADDL
jgi:lysyl-tRNA synthetase class 2